LRRKHREALLKWYDSTGRKPLIIRGARQVGKSTLVRHFCQENKITLFEINLEKYPQLNEAFKTKNCTYVLEILEDILQVKILTHPNKKILFLDEIQACDAAVSCLRYFYEELKELPIVCAGSLLEFHLNDQHYPMPVGRVDFLYMGPMDFEEFLWAKNETYFYQKLLSLKAVEEISDEFHQKGLALLKEYFFVGGMPEAVLTLIEKSFDEVSHIHSQIMQTYQNDFFRYGRKSELSRIDTVFRYLYLNPCIKIKYSNISQDSQSRDLKNCLNLLCMAKVANKVHHTHSQGIPLEAGQKDNVYKMILLDIGLMNHMMGLRWNNLKKLTEKEIITDGVMAEQFIGQHLLYHAPSYQEPKLHYWLREGKSSNAEVDFLLQHEDQLIAIEVKSGSAGKIRSLHQWWNDIKYDKKKTIRFNMSKGQVENVSYQMGHKKIDYELVTLPLYYVIKDFIR